MEVFGFTLLTSLTLNGRSRFKDLWIFLGLSQAIPNESRPSSPLESRADSKLASSDRIRGRRGSYPAPTGNSLAASNPRGHTRAASSNNISSTGPISSISGVVRKPAPRAQLPVSVAHSNASNDNVPEAETPRHRTTHADELRMELQSSIGSAVDMTGVGTHKYTRVGEPEESVHQRMPSRFYGNLHFPGTPAPGVNVPQNGGPHGSAQLFGGTSGRLDAQLTSRDANPAPNPSRSRPSHRKSTSQAETPPLLGPGAFRDSANSSNSNHTVDVPIAWTGAGKENGHSRGRSRSRDPKDNALPGGWVSPTGVKESKVPGDHANPNESHRHKHSMTPLSQPEEQEVKAGTPELVYPKVRPARSGRATLVTDTPRAEIYGTKAPERLPVPASTYPTLGRRDHNPAKMPGEGWVLVNVGHPGMPGAPPHASSPPPQHSLHRKQSFPPMSEQRPPPAHSPYSTGSRAVPTDNSVGGHKKSRSTNYNPSSMSPAAKAIVVFDAIEAKRKATSGDASQSSFRKFFSLSRPDSPGKSPGKEKKLALTSGGSKSKLLEQEDSTNIREGAARDRVRTRGTPEGRKSSRRMTAN